MQEYPLRIPEGKKDVFLENLSRIPQEERFSVESYVVKKGDTFKTISKKTGIPVQVILDINDMEKIMPLKPGTELALPSMGGGITRAAAEDPAKKYAGTLIIAGAGGDLPTRTARQRRLAELSPGIDPRQHPGLTDDDPKGQAFAAVIGTPVAARRLWPYTATNAVNAAARAPQPAGENAAGRVWVPTIEVAGKLYETDEEGYLVNLGEWNEEVANHIAKTENIEMSQQHWEVVNFLRDYYNEFQIAPAVRVLTKAIGKKLGPEKGNSQYLYELLPGSISRIARATRAPWPISRRPGPRRNFTSPTEDGGKF